jgi:rhomboid protease GluP
MLFLRYESFTGYLRLYPITSIIIVVNLIIFILMSMSGGSTNPITLYSFGALVKEAIVQGEYWRLVSAIFLHIGVSHLLFNSFSTFLFAPPLERFLGKWKFIIFYVITGTLGNAISLLFMGSQTISAGASTSIYAIFGAFLFMALKRKDLLDHHSSQTIKMILVIGIIYSILIPQINLSAHMGGLIAGFFMAGFMLGSTKQT